MIMSNRVFVLFFSFLFFSLGVVLINLIWEHKQNIWDEEKAENKEYAYEGKLKSKRDVENGAKVEQIEEEKNKQRQCWLFRHH